MENTSLALQVCINDNIPQDLLTSRGQVAVNKPKRCSVEEKGDTHSSLVSCSNRNCQPQTSSFSKTYFTLAACALMSLTASPGILPSVLPRPVLTLAVFTCLRRPSCSGFTNTASLIFQRDCTATYRAESHITRHDDAFQINTPDCKHQSYFNMKFCFRSRLRVSINKFSHTSEL